MSLTPQERCRAWTKASYYSERCRAAGDAKAGLCSAHARAEGDVECIKQGGDLSELVRTPPMRRDNILRMVEDACRRGEMERGELLLREIERRIPNDEPPTHEPGRVWLATWEPKGWRTAAHRDAAEAEEWEPLDGARRVRWGVFYSEGDSADPLAVFQEEEAANTWAAEDRGEDGPSVHSLVVLKIRDLKGRVLNSYEEPEPRGDVSEDVVDVGTAPDEADG